MDVLDFLLIVFLSSPYFLCSKYVSLMINKLEQLYYIGLVAYCHLRAFGNFPNFMKSTIDMKPYLILLWKISVSHLS